MKAQFLLSTLTEFPKMKNSRGKIYPQVAIAGKSNVGKSSLINHYFNQKNLAKTSATPGKTRLLNFFLIDEKYLLVDLPGYGFAKAAKEEIEKFSQAIDRYLTQAADLSLLLILIDSRRDISPQDQNLIDWAEENQIPSLLIFTKTDKLSRSEIGKLKNKHPDAIFYSVKDKGGKIILNKKIEQVLWD